MILNTVKYYAICRYGYTDLLRYYNETQIELLSYCVGTVLYSYETELRYYWTTYTSWKF